MKKIFILFLIILSYSCSINNKNLGYSKINFKKDFKFQAYCSCILYGYEDKGVTSKMIEIDKSFYNPVINSVFYKEIIKISLIEAKIMKLDSINSIQKLSEGKAGKYVLSHCLNFYKGKKLDSITNSNYIKWKNIKNLDSIIMKDVPTY